MANILFYVTISILYYSSAAATNTANIGVLANKIQNTAAAAQSSVTKLATEATSNDSEANLHLYDLMVDSFTINGTKVKLSSKASKSPSRSPIVTMVTDTATDDDSSVDDNLFQNVWNGTDDDVRSIPTTIFPEASIIGDGDTPAPIEAVTSATESPAPSPFSNVSGYTTLIPTHATGTSQPTLNSASSAAPSINSLELAESSSTPSSSGTLLPTSSFTATTYPHNNNSSSGAGSNRASSPSPSFLNTLAPIKSKASKAPTAAPLIDCPDQFNSSIEYHEFDLVSMGPIIYECKEWPKDVYCNSFEPGTNFSSHGWIVLGPCLPSPTQSPAIVQRSLSPSSFSPTQPSTEDNATATNSPTMMDPTPMPTDNSSSVSSSPSIDDNLYVNLPRIICDISLSPKLAPSFEKKHILLVAMTNTIFQILDNHLEKALYEIVGVSLGVHVSLYKNGNDTATTIRLKADFNGTASFSLGAPTERDLVDVLLGHFSIDEFTRRLVSPLKAFRVIQDPIVIVNSVFFSLQDGMLLPADGVNDRVGSPATIKSDAKLEGANQQLAVGVFALTAVGFALAMVLFVAHSRNNIEWEEDETCLSEPPYSNNRGDNRTPTKTKAGQSDPQVQINTRKKNPYFGGIDSISDLSSLSASPYTERTVATQDIVPFNPSLGIGIAAPNHRYFAGSRTPYTDEASVSYDKEWKVRSCMLETP